MSEFAIAEVFPGRLNALVKNMMRQMDINDPNEAVRRVNSGEWVVQQAIRAWSEEDGVVYFSVTSNGTTGEEWITRLESKGFRVSDYAKSILRSSDFKPTNGITTVAVLKGVLFGDNERTTKNIRTKAYSGEFTQGWKLSDPNAELACLIREKFSDEEIEAMGLWAIVAMHEPIKDSDGDPRLLNARRFGGGRWLDAYWDSPDGRWDRAFGFAFSLAS